MNRFSAPAMAVVVSVGVALSLTSCITTSSSDDTTQPPTDTTATTVNATTAATTGPPTSAPSSTSAIVSSPTTSPAVSSAPAAISTDSTPSDPQPVSAAAQLVRSSVDTTLEASSFTVDAETRLEIGEQSILLTVDGYKSAKLADVHIYVDEDGKVSEVYAKTDGNKVWLQNDDSRGKWIESDTTEIPPTGIPANGLIGPVIMLRGVEEVTVGPTSEVDGTTVTEYSATVPYIDAVAAASELEADFTSALRLTGEGEKANLNIVALIGEDSIVRDLRFDIENEFVTGGGSVVLTGVNQSVPKPDPPPADLIVPAS